MEHLEREIAFFKTKQSELARDHHGKFVVIHAESMAGFYGSDLEAYTEARKKMGTKTFLIRQCVRPEEEIHHTFHSRFA
jgi:hypothetical protein